MLRLHLTVEGRTEQNFATRVLAPHLLPYGVYLRKPRLAALKRKKQSVHRGGMSHYLPVKTDILNWLKEDRSPDCRFTTMFDLYGLPTDFPAYTEARALANPHQRVDRLEAALEGDIGEERFIPYIQLHEFEALLLSDPGALAAFYPRHTREIGDLSRQCAEYSSPELIDDGQLTAPSKRIGAAVPAYPDRKASDGSLIAEQIGIETIRAKCSHFDRWLSRLEALGGQG